MNHKELINLFVEKGINKLNETLNSKYNYYHKEFPFLCKDNKTLYTDLILKDFDNNNYVVIEFKTEEINYEALNQCLTYVDLLKRKFYLKEKPLGIIVSQIAISKEEINKCKKENIIPIIFNEKMFKIVN